MDAWLFSSADKLYALAGDDAGADLPAELGPWIRTRHVTLQADVSDERTAISLIREHGFCCFE